MSVYNPLTFAVHSQSMPKASSATFSADGQALMGAITAGVYGVLPTAGAGTDAFVGFLHAQTSAVPFLQTTAVMVEEITLSASGTATLAKTPLGGTLSIWNITDNVAVGGGDITLSGAGITLVAAHFNETVRCTYAYTLTVAAARAKFGDVQPGGYFGDTVGYASVLRKGTIYTDQFDTSVQWASATAVKSAAGGKVTVGGAGATLPVQIVSIPTANLQYLGLSVNAD